MAYIPILKTIINSMFKRPATYAYPKKPMPKDAIVRGGVHIEIDACIFCGICVRKCPTGALTVNKEKKEWGIAHFQCIICGACIEACPKKCLKMLPELTPASDSPSESVFTTGA